MSVVTILKRLAGIRPDDVEGAATGLKAIEADLNSAIAEFSAAQRDFGERLVIAMGEGNAHEVELDLEAKRRKVERLTHAVEALTSRHMAAQAAAQGVELAKRWHIAEAALRERTEALVRFERAVTEAGKKLLEAEAAASRAWQAMPVKPSGGPHYLSLDSEVSALLSLATQGRAGGYRGSVLWDLQQRPGLVARAEANSREWLRAGEAHLEGSEPPPKAA